MASSKKKITGSTLARFRQKRHYCQEHDEECQVIKLAKRWRTRFRCPKGCDLSKKETVLRVPRTASAD